MLVKTAIVATVAALSGAGYSSCNDPIDVDFPMTSSEPSEPSPGKAGELLIVGIVVVDDSSYGRNIPIPGAVVVTTRGWNWTDSTVTDTTGHFRVSVPPPDGETHVDCDDIDLEATAEGYESRTWSLWSTIGQLFSVPSCPGDGEVNPFLELLPES